MDLAKVLVRSVMRAFYDTRHILVIDALVIHSALRDDDLAYLMSMNTKDLHKLCAKLRDDRFLVVHTRSELREGQQRPINRTYYYIDYRQTIDAIKWRVYKIDKDMQGQALPANERKEYFCQRDGCRSSWTQMEVLDNVGPQGFLCHRCGSVLVHDVDRGSGGHQQSTRMNNQFKFITDQLPKIDSVVVPDNTFDVALQHARPVTRDATHQVARSIAVEPGTLRPTAVKGLANTGPKSMQVSISTSDGPSQEEQAAEQALREKIAKQNALPSWMSNSTITGESFSAGAALAAGGPAIIKTGADAKDPDIKQPADAKDHADTDDYFARLKAEMAAEDARRRAMDDEDEDDDDDDEEEEDDDDDEGDFEDVVATGTSAAGTPASTAGNGVGTAPVVPSPLHQSSVSLKREASSGPSTGTTSPAAGNTPGSDGRPAKKVKVEEPPAADEESEEDVEFEDVKDLVG